MQQPNGATCLAGVFGWPVEHSLSPPMQNAAFRQLGLNWLYVAFAVAPENLGQSLKALAGLGIRGVNLTIPHKEAALQYMDALGQEAEETGAINTVQLTEGRLIGHNTDGEGFWGPLQAAGFRAKGSRVVLMGAGGAARAAAFRLAREGAAVTLANRTLQRAERLADAVEAKYPGSIRNLIALEESRTLQENIAEAHLLVNTTRLGMWPHLDEKPPVTAEMMHNALIVYDLVYNPVETVLLQQAGQAGCITLPGTHMLVRQGMEAFTIWTGMQPSYEVMEKALLEALEKRQNG